MKRLRATNWPCESSLNLRQLGVTVSDLGRYEEALASYEQAIRITPDYAPAYANSGNTFQHLKRLDEAVACYRRAPAFFRLGKEKTQEIVLGFFNQLGITAAVTAPTAVAGWPGPASPSPLDQ
jgi:tetratricopeptide (TPR) repeat protein